MRQEDDYLGPRVQESLDNIVRLHLGDKKQKMITLVAALWTLGHGKQRDQLEGPFNKQSKCNAASLKQRSRLADGFRIYSGNREE